MFEYLPGGDMTQFEQVSGCDLMSTVNFFLYHISDVASGTNFSPDEKAYTASILAHYAQVSRGSGTDMPPCTDLADIFHTFVLPIIFGSGDVDLSDSDPEIAEIAGSQTLLLAGFFRDQMKRRHNIRVFDHFGQTFYGLSAGLCKDHRRRDLLERMATNFPLWTETCCQVSRVLRDNPYLIRPFGLPPAAS
jgi:hypothetical protein